MSRSQLSYQQVLDNRKYELFIHDDHCMVCNKTYTNVPLWTNHIKTQRHKQARKGLLAQLRRKSRIITSISTKSSSPVISRRSPSNHLLFRDFSLSPVISNVSTPTPSQPAISRRLPSPIPLLPPTPPLNCKSASGRKRLRNVILNDTTNDIKRRKLSMNKNNFYTNDNIKINSNNNNMNTPQIQTNTNINNKYTLQVTYVQQNNGQLDNNSNNNTSHTMTNWPHINSDGQCNRQKIKNNNSNNNSNNSNNNNHNSNDKHSQWEHESSSPFISNVWPPAISRRITSPVIAVDKGNNSINNNNNLNDKSPTRVEWKQLSSVDHRNNNRNDKSGIDELVGLFLVLCVGIILYICYIWFCYYLKALINFSLLCLVVGFFCVLFVCVNNMGILNGIFEDDTPSSVIGCCLFVLCVGAIIDIFGY